MILCSTTITHIILYTACILFLRSNWAYCHEPTPFWIFNTKQVRLVSVVLLLRNLSSANRCRGCHSTTFLHAYWWIWWLWSLATSSILQLSLRFILGEVITLSIWRRNLSRSVPRDRTLKLRIVSALRPLRSSSWWLAHCAFIFLLVELVFFDLFMCSCLLRSQLPNDFPLFC